MKAKVVVTSGATREPIDSVRFISNLSSGRTGAMIGEALAARGFHVTQVAGVDSVQASGVARRETFTDHASLDTALRRLARDSACMAIVHAAAVGDFSVADAQPDAKIASGGELSVKLQPTHKIIDRIMGYAGNPDLILVGFKLTHEPDASAQARAARELLKRSRARYVVQNDVSTLADGEEHLFFVHENGSSRVRRYVGREKLATALAVLIEEQLKGHRAMILVLDIGNSQIYGGVFDDDRLVLQFRRTTRAENTSDEFGLFCRQVLRENDVDPRGHHRGRDLLGRARHGALGAKRQHEVLRPPAVPARAGRAHRAQDPLPQPARGRQRPHRGRDRGGQAVPRPERDHRGLRHGDDHRRADRRSATTSAA